MINYVVDFNNGTSYKIRLACGFFLYRQDCFVTVKNIAFIITLAQIKNLYKNTWEIITGNCDSLLFLGGMEQSTLEYISKMCGKTTIDNRNINESKGQSGSYSLNYQVLGRDLITPDEVGGLKGRECILKIRGCKPFRSQKFDIQEHENYKLLSDASKSNWFEIEQRTE